MQEVNKNEFVHLHLHSEYSLLDGACRISEIPKKAKELGQSAVAITDHGVMYGCVAFYDACKAEGIKPIIGCEVYVSRGALTEKSGEHDHLVLLVENETGYRNLIYMLSVANVRGFYRKPRIDIELLRERHEGLIALSACLSGRIPRYLAVGKHREATEYALELDRIFGRGNFYLEIQDEGLEGQKMINECLMGISLNTGIPLVATNDVHYLSRCDAKTQAVLTCIQTGSKLDDGRPIGFETDEFYMKSSDEMTEIFGSFGDAVKNTVRIAERCSFEFTFGSTVLPEFMPPDGLSADAYLRKLTENGLDDRVSTGDIVFNDNHGIDEYRARIEYELLVISSMGYSSYFLIVADFVNYAKEIEVPTGPGRGSGAGSLVAYLIGITEVDPVTYGLLFEAFLNRERISMPDFDIDFGDKRRDEVIAYVADKYGSDRVAQITTFGTLAMKAALRDCGRVLGMSYNRVDTVVKALNDDTSSLKEAVTKGDFKLMYEDDDEIRELVDIAMSLEGMPRNASTHAAGVVITAKPVSDYVPLSVNGDVVVTQYDMDTVARLGLLKFDFLALRYLSVEDDTVRLIRETDPIFSLKKIPLDDAETYSLISSGATDGVFQLESPGMIKLLMKMKPTKITDIMVAIALFRPGPMDSIPVFLENKKKEKIDYKIGCLNEILDETCGCIVYQEQVMEIFRRVAGYTYGRADVVRRAIAKKKPGVIEKEKDGFIKGAVANGYGNDDADELFGMMTDFANYAFKKSHSAAYGLISYRTAWLKTHYPAEYYSSLLASVQGNLAKTAAYIDECGKRGIKVLPPDINESKTSFSVKDGAIRFGLSAVKGVGGVFTDRAISERANGRYRTFAGFVGRNSGSDMNRRQIENLIKAGAFDNLDCSRRQLLLNYEAVIDKFGSKAGSMKGQMGFFDSEEPRYSYPTVPDMSLKEKLAAEKETCGLYLSGHISDEYSDNISDISHIPLSAVRETEGKTQVTVCGTVTGNEIKITKKGDRMLVSSVEDRYFSVGIIAFPNTFEEYSAVLTEGATVCINGYMSVDEKESKIIVRKAISLIPNGKYVKKHSVAPVKSEEKKTDKPKRLFIRLDSKGSHNWERCQALVNIFEGGTPVYFYDSSKGDYTPTGQSGVNEFLLGEFAEIVGKENVVFK